MEAGVSQELAEERFYRDDVGVQRYRPREGFLNIYIFLEPAYKQLISSSVQSIQLRVCM